MEEFPSFTVAVDGNTNCVDGTDSVVITGTTNTGGLTWSINGPCTAAQVDSMFTLGNVNANCSGTYSVTAASPIGCSSTETVNLDITDKPVTPAFQATADTVCMGGSTTLFLTNIPSGANLLCYENGVQTACNIGGPYTA